MTTDGINHLQIKRSIESLLKMSRKRKCIEKDQQISDDGDKDPKQVVINSLNHDCLAKIIMLLPIPERIKAAKVCTKWREACQLAWYDIKKYKCETSIGRSYNNRLLTQRYVEKILLMRGHYLTELSLSDICKSSIMSIVGDHCKNLISLECEFAVVSLIYYADHFIRAFTQLNQLKCIKIKLKHERKYERLNLFEIINSLPEEMSEIHIFPEQNTKQKLQISMSLQKFTNLKKLSLRSPFSDNILQEIAEKTTLVHLDICLYDTRIEFSLFKKLVNLEYIDLTESDILGSCTTKILYTIFCSCKNLKHLDTPQGSYDLAKIPSKTWINLRNLEYLGVCYKIMPDLANTIVGYCKNLKHLKLDYPDHSVNETALKKLTKLENLESLEMSSIIQLSKKSIIAISNNCKKLKCLNISYSYMVSSVPSDSLSPPYVIDELSKLQYLEQLDLSYTTYIKDSTITAISNNCKNLKSLNLQHCSGISEIALVSLTNLKNLEKLNVGGLDISDSFIMKLKELKRMHCSSCYKLTDDGIIQLIKNNPDLEVIDICDTDKITINLVIAADQITKNRANGIILHLKIDEDLRKDSELLITSEWLVTE